MKKYFSILLAALLTGAMALSASATIHITTVNDAEVIDNEDTNSEGGSGNPIQIMDDYGCGYSSRGDKVVFEDVDFGTYGAADATMHFGYAGSDVSILTFYIDGEVALENFEVSNTGGWDIASSGWVDLPLAVPAGIHTITCEFVGTESGSLSEIKFNEAYPDAYLSVTTVKDAEVIDNEDTNSEGGSGNPIQIMDDYGCGYASRGDKIVFKDIDFGTYGAADATMHFGYAGSGVCILTFYIDGEVALENFAVSNTGGWDIESSGWVDLPLAVPAGIHTITCEFVGTESGSLSEIKFNEAEPAPVEDVAVDATDLAILQKYFSGYAVEIGDTTLLDCNGDNKFTRADVMYLARALANWEGYSLSTAD